MGILELRQCVERWIAESYHVSLKHTMHHNLTTFSRHVIPPTHTPRFAGGPGIFIHHAAGVTEATWAHNTAEVTYELDAAIVSMLGGADVWSDGVRGESMLHWRIHRATAKENSARKFTPLLHDWQQHACEPGSKVLLIEIVAPVPRSGRDSWHLNIPLRVLQATDTTTAGVGAVAVALGGSAGVAMKQEGDMMRLRAVQGAHHVIGLCLLAQKAESGVDL